MLTALEHGVAAVPAVGPEEIDVGGPEEGQEGKAHAKQCGSGLWWGWGCLEGL